ncbi:chromatin accessibility complex protein 1 [Leucoraja erinacea]|uniref:chromatin accessibility complex protein 1 n=1 Tax=Leucoraja erinaceus TaxID=7782 RepID=UPI002453EA85|nr:chromatin accessibility complex protein 1 [Leucoraja erinacea]
MNSSALFGVFFGRELFVQHLATYAYKSNSSEKKELTYNDLADCVENCETFQFLADILPKKILASEYLKMLEEEKDGVGGAEADGDNENDEDDDDEEEEDEDEDENES